jgi:hypothetical protein
MCKGDKSVLCETQVNLRLLNTCFSTVLLLKSVGRKISFDWEENMDLSNRLIRGQVMHNNLCFLEASLIAAWELWKLRNDKVFQRCDPSPSIWLCNFKNQCTMQCLRFKDDPRSFFCVWLDSFS